MRQNDVPRTGYSSTRRPAAGRQRVFSAATTVVHPVYSQPTRPGHIGVSETATDDRA